MEPDPLEEAVDCLDPTDLDMGEVGHGPMLPAVQTGYSTGCVPAPSYHRLMAASRTIAHLDMDAFYARSSCGAGRS